LILIDKRERERERERDEMYEDVSRMSCEEGGRGETKIVRKE